MCGRYFQNQPRDELAAAFRAAPSAGEDRSSYNIAPGQLVLAVRLHPKTGERWLDDLQWGLLPHFAKERKMAWKTINARAETIDKAASYRAAFEKRRCLILADGFFEWKALGKQRLPYAVTLAGREPFAMAGVWENWKDPVSGEWVRSCAIVTTAANELIGQVHDRMPVILAPADYASWLGEEPKTASELKRLLEPFSAQVMAMWPVHPRVNKTDVNDPSVLDRYDPEDR
jgi:putative SOS response-associated peptidase YedK